MLDLVHWMDWIAAVASSLDGYPSSQYRDFEVEKTLIELFQ
jgi:hypothetical protein